MAARTERTEQDTGMGAGRPPVAPTPDPITLGAPHSLDAWRRWWDAHGYEPWALERDQASDRAQALMDEADRLLERYRLDAEHNGSGVEMRRFGEEVLIPMTAPHGAQIHAWAPTDDYEPADLPGLIADELNQYTPLDDSDDEQYDTQWFHNAAARIDADHAHESDTTRDATTTLDPADPTAMSAMGPTGTDTNVR